MYFDVSVAAVCVYDQLCVKKGFQWLLLCDLRLKCLIIFSLQKPMCASVGDYRIFDNVVSIYPVQRDLTALC